MRTETLAVHGGYEGDSATRAVAVPIPLLDPVTMTTWEVIGSGPGHRGTIPQLADHP